MRPGFLQTGPGEPWPSQAAKPLFSQIAFAALHNCNPDILLRRTNAMVWSRLDGHIQRMMKREILTHLRDGHPVRMRPLRRDDRPHLVAGIDSLTERSRYLRFFTGARRLPDHVIDRLVDVDNVHHIAWGALDETGEAARAIGVVHAIRPDEGSEAELAFGVVDEFHARGLARMLIAAVAHDCARCGITTLKADTLAENRAAAKLIRHIGGYCCEAAGGIYTFRLNVADCESRLRSLAMPKGLGDVYHALDAEDARRAA